MRIACVTFTIQQLSDVVLIQDRIQSPMAVEPTPSNSNGSRFLRARSEVSGPLQEIKAKSGLLE